MSKALSLDTALSHILNVPCLFISVSLFISFCWYWARVFPGHNGGPVWGGIAILEQGVMIRCNIWVGYGMVGVMYRWAIVFTRHRVEAIVLSSENEENSPSM